MSNCIAFTFENLDQCEAFVEFLKTCDDPIVEEALANRVYNTNPDQCSLWVSGTKLFEGNLSDMQKQFAQECASHAASVVLKEYRNGDWHDIRARRLQQQQ
jgi:hypothetical protein